MVSTYETLEPEDMLEVTVDIVRRRDGKRIPIAILEAENIGGTDMHGNYNLRLYEYAHSAKTVRRATLERFQRSRGALALVRIALQQAFGK